MAANHLGPAAPKPRGLDLASASQGLDEGSQSRPCQCLTHLIIRHFLYEGSQSRPCQCLTHGGIRRGAGWAAVQIERLERRQRAAVERSDEGGAAGVGDLGAAEVEPLELRQPSSRRRRRTCWQRRRQEGGEALVAKRVANEIDALQRGQPPQGRREGRQTRVTDAGADQR